jgi:hypothetical protein
MSSYKEIFGFKIKNVSSDPANFQVGEVWYNTTDDVLKLGADTGPTGAWASGTSIPAQRQGGVDGGFGTPTAAIIMFGTSGAPAYTAYTTTFEYDGTTWSPSGATPYASNGVGSTGPINAGAVFGGQVIPGPGPGGGPESGTTRIATLEYDGSTFSSGGNMNIYRYSPAGFGADQNDAVSAGGSSPAQGAGTKKNSTETYNGTSWTNIPATLGTARTTGGGGTSSSDGLALGGSPGQNTNESYDGSTWSSITNAPNNTQGGQPQGPASDFMVAGGYTGPTSHAKTMIWNGTTWSTKADMNTNRYGGYTGKQQSSSSTGLVAGGNAGPSNATVATTEEFSAGPFTKTITTS